MGKIAADKEENEVTSERQTDMAPAFPSSDLALLKTQKALWKQTINKRGGGAGAPDTVSLQCAVCISHVFSAAAQRRGVLAQSRAEWAAG